VAKLDPSQSGSQALIYATYIGGPGADGASAVAVDASGNAYVAGYTQGDFPVTPGAFQTSQYFPSGCGGGGVFVSKLSAGGSQLAYSTYVGLCGSSANGIAVDALGDAYVVGDTGLDAYWKR
jgi:hypothetical protein